MAEFPASLLILNGKSADNEQLREAIMLLRDEGIKIHVRVTWEKAMLRVLSMKPANLVLQQ